MTGHIILPTEIEREIFELVARTDLSSAIKCLLIAEHVYQWIIPVAYEAIQIDDRRMEIHRVLCSNPSGLMHTKHLIFRTRTNRQLERINKVEEQTYSAANVILSCPSLTHVHLELDHLLWIRNRSSDGLSRLATFPDVLPMVPNLQMLVLGGRFPDWSLHNSLKCSPSRDVPLAYTALTHVALEACPSWHECLFLPSLPALTHLLIFKVTQDSMELMQPDIEILLAKRNRKDELQMRLILLTPLPSPSRGLWKRTNLRELELHQEKRLVLLDVLHNPREERHDYWERIDKLFALGELVLDQRLRENIL